MFKEHGAVLYIDSAWCELVKSIILKKDFPLPECKTSCIILMKVFDCKRNPSIGWFSDGTKGGEWGGI